MSREYLAPPIFCPDVDYMGHVEVYELPISDALKEGISAWDAEYQLTFNGESPSDSGFCSYEESSRHEIDGRCLADKLQQELGDGCIVEYFP